MLFSVNNFNHCESVDVNVILFIITAANTITSIINITTTIINIAITIIVNNTFSPATQQ